MEQLERLPIVAPIFAAPAPALLRDAPAPDEALALPALQAAAQPIAVAPRFGTPVARRAVLLAARPRFLADHVAAPLAREPGAGMPASLASLLAAGPQLNLAATNAAARVVNVATTAALTAAAGDGAVADDLAALEAKVKRIRAEAEQAVADKDRVIEDKTTAYIALVDVHNALVATRDQRVAQAQAATNAVQPQLQQLKAEHQTLQGQLGALATAMNDRFIAANAAIEALTAFDKAVQEGTEPDAQEHARLYAEYLQRFDAVREELVATVASRDDEIEKLGAYDAEAQADLEQRRERLNSRIEDAKAAWNTYVERGTRFNNLVDERRAAFAAGDLIRTSALTDQIDALEPDVLSARDKFDAIERDVEGFDKDFSDAFARAKERVKEFDAEIKRLETAAEELNAELKEIDTAYGTKLDPLKAKIDRRYDELTAQLNAATGVIEAEYGPQADRLMALLAALYDTGDVAGALTAINAIPTHDAALRLAEAAKLIAALQLAQNQAAALAGPANALWAQVDTLVAQVEASGQTLRQKKDEFDVLVRERDEFIEQKQAEIEQLLAGAPRPQLDVRALSDHACPNAEFFLEALVPSNATGLTWTSGGTPSTGAGRIYRTRFSGLPRDEVIELLWDHFTGPIRLLITVPVWALSGAEWWHLFAGSEDVNQLVPSFRDKVKKFKAALEEAGANVKVGSTYRPLQRSYLMHFAWRLVLPPGDRDRVTPDQVPQFNRGLLEPGALETGPVEICWLHRDAAGNPDAPASVAAAQAMKVKYDLKHRPAFPGSKHYVGKAIDLTIEWSGDLKIKDAAGNPKTISSLPRNGDNRDLHAVGATYEIRKLVDDQPHWYED